MSLFVRQRTLRPGKSLEVHQQIVLRRNSVIYIGENLLFGRVNLVLGYGLFGIFNQQSSHNIRKCFHILWLDKLHSMQSLWLSLWKIVRRLEKSSQALLVGLVSVCSVQIWTFKRFCTNWSLEQCSAVYWWCLPIRIRRLSQLHCSGHWLTCRPALYCSHWNIPGNMQLHPLEQAIWAHIWKHTVGNSCDSIVSTGLLYPLDRTKMYFKTVREDWKYTWPLTCTAVHCKSPVTHKYDKMCNDCVACRGRPANYFILTGPTKHSGREILDSPSTVGKSGTH